MLVELFQRRRADILMLFIILVWGMNFLVMKENIRHVPPLTFTTLCFLTGLPVFLGIAVRDRSIRALSRRDLLLLAVTALTGPVVFHTLFILGLRRTTSTNSALIVATVPAWTAIFCFILGMIVLRRKLLIGLIITLGGVGLVVLGHSGAKVSTAQSDLFGSLLILLAAIFGSLGDIIIKPTLDRLGSTKLVAWRYGFTTMFLTLIALPGMIRTPVKITGPLLVSMLYTGLLCNAVGFLIFYYAIRHMGPARATTYHNFTPLIAAAGGILFLHDAVPITLIIGGALTLWGVTVVRKNMEAAPTPAALPQPAEEVA